MVVGEGTWGLGMISNGVVVDDVGKVELAGLDGDGGHVWEMEVEEGRE